MLSRLLMLFGLMLLPSVVYAAADKGHPVTRPVPIKIEGQMGPSCLYITMNETEYKRPLSAVAADLGNDAPEKVLHAIVVAVNSNDLAAYKTRAVPESEEDPADRFEMYRTIFAKAQDPVLLWRWDLGDAVYLLLDIGSSEYPKVGFLLKKSQGRYLNSFNDLGNPWCQIVSSLTRGMESDPKAFGPVAAGGKYSVSLLPFGSDQSSPVIISFDAVRINHVVPPSSQPATRGTARETPEVDALVRSYARRLALLQEGKTDEYLQSLGPVSRTNLKGHFQRPGKLEQYKQALSSPRRLRLLIGSKDVFILVYQTSDGPYPKNVFLYDLLYKAPGGPIWQVNVGAEGPFDALLRDPQFDKLVREEVIDKEADVKPERDSK